MLKDTNNQAYKVLRFNRKEVEIEFDFDNNEYIPVVIYDIDNDYKIKKIGNNKIIYENK